VIVIVVFSEKSLSEQDLVISETRATSLIKTSFFIGATIILTINFSKYAGMYK